MASELAAPSNTVANIQLLCGACNRAKGAKLKLAAGRGRGASPP
jgi:5-methylcytosine-specific restriction endonuclease McrA